MIKYRYTSLSELYNSSISSYGQRDCFSIFGGERLTYDGFSDRVSELSLLLKSHGLAAGDKVAILGQNMPNWCVSYFAAVTEGMVAVPILPDFSPDQVNEIVKHSESKAVVVSKKQYTKLSREVLSSLNVVICMDDLSVSESREGLSRVFRSETIDAGTLAVIIYTSGTTSSPKGVMLTHGNLCSQLEMVTALQTIEKEDVLVSLLPLSHTYECSLGMLLPFMSGASVVYISKPPTANVLLPVFSKVRPTMILSVPLIIEKIFKNQISPALTGNGFNRALYSIPFVRRILHRIAGARLMKSFGGRVRFFGVGGAKLDPVVERFLFEARFPYAIGYGLTETAPLIAGANPSMCRIQSTGPCLKGIEIRIDNPNPATGEGELVIRGANVMRGYYKNPEATAESFTADGWFRTKDLVAVDSDGYLYVKGRLGNMILGASGENIYPEEIEYVINQNSLVVDSIVREDKGRLVALVQFNREELEKKYDAVKGELEAKIEALKPEIIRYVNSKVNRFSKISLVVEQRSTFEKTPTHKIKRFLYNGTSVNKEW